LKNAVFIVQYRREKCNMVISNRAKKDYPMTKQGENRENSTSLL